MVAADRFDHAISPQGHVAAPEQACPADVRGKSPLRGHTRIGESRGRAELDVVDGIRDREGQHPATFGLDLGALPGRQWPQLLNAQRGAPRTPHSVKAAGYPQPESWSSDY